MCGATLETFTLTQVRIKQSNLTFCWTKAWIYYEGPKTFYVCTYRDNPIQLRCNAFLPEIHCCWLMGGTQVGLSRKVALMLMIEAKLCCFQA